LTDNKKKRIYPSSKQFKQKGLRAKFMPTNIPNSSQITQLTPKKKCSFEKIPAQIQHKYSKHKLPKIDTRTKGFDSKIHTNIHTKFKPNYTIDTTQKKRHVVSKKIEI